MSRPALTPSHEGPRRPAAEMRLASRLSVAFLLDLIHIRRRGRHVLDMLLSVAVIQANVAEISRRADLQIAYSEFGDPPPDELRRPISQSALANSLGLPFETVRRRVKAMAADQLCLIVDGGVIVPAAVLSAPENMVSGLAVYERMRAFYEQIDSLGLLHDLPRPSVALPGDAAPLRAMGRLTADYVLRVVETLVAITGDVLDALIFLEVFRQNIGHLPVQLPQGETLEARDMAPDDLRRPVSMLALAARLGLPAETVRRRIIQLVEADICERHKGGIIVPARAMARPAVQAAIVANAANLQRLFAGLAQLGVLDLWDRMRTRPASFRVP